MAKLTSTITKVEAQLRASNGEGCSSHGSDRDAPGAPGSGGACSAASRGRGLGQAGPSPGPVGSFMQTLLDGPECKLDLAKALEAQGLAVEHCARMTRALRRYFSRSACRAWT